MAKRMAKLHSGIVENILWCSDLEPETAVLVHTGDVPVWIGDSFRGGKFYRDGEPVLEPMQALEQAHTQELAQLIQEVYEGDLEVIG